MRDFLCKSVGIEFKRRSQRIMIMTKGVETVNYVNKYGPAHCKKVEKKKEYSCDFGDNVSETAMTAIRLQNTKSSYEWNSIGIRNERGKNVPSFQWEVLSFSMCHQSASGLLIRSGREV